ncbi:HET-domain-containing protein, partial [Hyaloscypha bicolor E]
LPLTFQHAIHLTRQLDLNYFWVDVLCIVQDCPEEKKREPDSMGKVFVNAHCTIASSEDANGGCFTKRNSSLLDFPCCLQFSKNNALTVRAQGQTHNLKSFTNEVDEKNLSWQSWGFQERLLSRRIIHFGPKFLFFECNTHIASQGTNASQPFREKQWLSNREKTLSAGWEIYLHGRWAELVIPFTRCKITEPSDRTNALLGLAQAIQDGDKELRYMHDLWRRYLLFDPLWFIESGQTNKQSEHRTRSWSWQSVHGEV